jgi:hypothetical protein
VHVLRDFRCLGEPSYDLNLQPSSPTPARHDTSRAPITMSKPTANWEKVGDKFYRKIQLYQAVFDQDLELENYNVVGAPYGGAVGRYVPLSAWIAHIS